jgi:metal-responsive CopG/Arc/MetJ family transcriptional regulator
MIQGGMIMGRPKVDEPKQQYTVMLQPSVVAEIERLAAIRGRKTRSEMLAGLIELGMEDLQSLEKLGLIRAAVISDKVFKKLKEAIFGGDVKLNKNGDLEIRK